MKSYLELAGSEYNNSLLNNGKTPLTYWLGEIWLAISWGLLAIKFMFLAFFSMYFSDQIDIRHRYLVLVT